MNLEDERRASGAAGGDAKKDDNRAKGKAQHPQGAK